MTEIEYLRKVYLKAETDIINEIARLRSRGLIDYHAVAALERVQAILKGLQDECWKYVPRVIEKQFYVNHPELYTRASKTLLQHMMGYANASALTLTEVDLVTRLVAQTMMALEESSGKILNDLSDLLIGRQERDLFRYVGLENVLRVQATGASVRAPEKFVEDLRREGVTAFVDKAGRHWSLHAYADMVTRTASRQAETLAVLTKYPDEDLYIMSSHNTGCAICAPFEGRVFSRSGTSPYYPPLSDAFGKVNKDGPNTLENTYLCIHPNCRHSIGVWLEDGKSKEEIQRMRRFSNPRTNPYTKDPRSEASIKAYQQRQRDRKEILDTYKQFELYRLSIPEKMPKSFETFRRHKAADDEKYKSWVAAYKDFSGEG